MTSPVAICGKGFSAEKKQTSTDHQFNQAFLIDTKLEVQYQSEESRTKIRPIVLTALV